MPVYQCKVRDHRGEAFMKVMNGDSAADVRNKLREMGYMVVTPVTEKRENKLAGSLKGGNNKFLDQLNNILANSGKVKLTDLTIFTRQFATMINAGVAMVRALNILEEQTLNPKLRKVILDLKARVEAGNSLSDCMSRHPRVFDRLFVGMIRAGEAGGVLDQVLLRVAGFIEANSKLQAQVKSAMTYPVVILIMAVVIFVVMLVFILPVFANMFEQMNAKLPAYTQFLIDMSNTARGPVGLMVAVTAFAIGWAIKTWGATDQGKHFIDKHILNVPIFGVLAQKIAVARFTRTLGTLLKSGVPLLSALEIVRDSSGNAIVSGAVEDVRQAVREGEGIARPLERAAVFPPMVTQMISIGEETGAVDSMLEKVADFYDDEVEQAVKSLTSLLEPLMMVLIAVLVGSLVIGMYLPVFTIINQIK
ncbi:type II secretion system F family protein [bacterium]|nr:type II secretion system F family protein [bacterium]